MRIAVFGGSFNPIHTGHCIIASTVASQPDIDEVWLMVSPQNPFKDEKELMSEKDRLKLAELAVSECPGVKVCDLEFSLPKPSYTYKTLLALRNKYPEHEFILLIGSDNWKVFQGWKDYDKILSEFEIVIYQRPDSKVSGPFPNGVKLLEDVPVMFMSSSYIRNRLRHGERIDYLVPDNIKEKLIKELWKQKD